MTDDELRTKRDRLKNALFQVLDVELKKAADTLKRIDKENPDAPVVADAAEIYKAAAAMHQAAIVYVANIES